MTKLRTLFLVAGLALSFSAVSIAAPPSPQIVHTTKRVSKKVYSKGRYITKTTWVHGKRISKKVWVKGNHIGRKVGTKTRHIVVGHHHHRRP